MAYDRIVNQEHQIVVIPEKLANNAATPDIIGTATQKPENTLLVISDNREIADRFMSLCDLMEMEVMLVENAEDVSSCILHHGKFRYAFVALSWREDELEVLRKLERSLDSVPLYVIRPKAPAIEGSFLADKAASVLPFPSRH